MAEFENFGFYTINADYLEYLNSKNSEVYYNASYRNAIKPFVGIIIDMTECKYFIPLASAKEKHKKWKNSCDEHFLIYEVIDKSVNISDDVYKEYSKDKKILVVKTQWGNGWEAEKRIVLVYGNKWSKALKYYLYIVLSMEEQSEKEDTDNRWW